MESTPLPHSFSSSSNTTSSTFKDQVSYYSKVTESHYDHSSGNAFQQQNLNTFGELLFLGDCHIRTTLAM